MDALFPIRVAIAERHAKELDTLPVVASPKIKLRGIQCDTPDLIQVTPVVTPKIPKKIFVNDEVTKSISNNDEKHKKISEIDVIPKKIFVNEELSKTFFDNDEKEKSEDLELVTPAHTSKILELSALEEQDRDPSSPDLTPKIRSRHASHSSRNEPVTTLPHTHGHSHNHSHIHTNGHANGINGHAGLPLNASSLHRDTLHRQGSTRSKHEKVASVLARLSERSHSLPGSRNSTLTNDHVSVLPDGHANPDISFSHVIPDPHNPSRRSKNHRNPFTGHLEHRSPSMPTHVNHSDIHHEPDLLMTTLPRVPGGSRHSTLSRHNSMGHRSHLSLAHDTEQDYYIHANRARYKDEARKQRFNLQTVMLIGCYTMLFVVAIIVGVVLCQQNGWLGFGSHSSESSKSGQTIDNTRGRRPTTFDYPDIMDSGPRNNRLPPDTTRLGVAGVGNIPRDPPQRPPANGGHQLRPGGNNAFANSGPSNSGKSFEILRAFDQNVNDFDFNSNNNQDFVNNNLGIENPTRGNNQGSIGNFGTNIGTNNNQANNNRGVNILDRMTDQSFGNNFNNPSNANNRGGLASFGISSTSDQGSFDINNSQGTFGNRNNQRTSNNGNLGDSGTSFNDNSGFSRNQGNRNNGEFNLGTSSIGEGFGSSGTNNKNNVGILNSGSTGGNRNTQGVLNNLSGTNTQANFDNDGFQNNQDSRDNQGQQNNFEMGNNQGSSVVRNNQGNQNRNIPNNQNRNIPGNQNRNNQGNQNRNNQGNQNRSNQGNQNRNNQGNQNRNNQGSFDNTGQRINQGNSNNNQMGFGVTGSRNNNSPTENQSNFGNVGSIDNLNIDAGFVKSQGVSNAQSPFDITGRRSNQGTSSIGNSEMTGIRNTANSGSQNRQNDVNLPGLQNTGNVQQGSGNRNRQNGVNLPGLPNTGNIQQGSGNRNRQTGVNLPGLPNTGNVQQGSGNRNRQTGVNLPGLPNTGNVQQGSGTRNRQNGVNLPGLQNTGNVQQGSGNRNRQNGVNLPGLQNTGNVQQVSGSQNGQNGVNLPGSQNSENVQEGSRNIFSQGDSRQTSLNQNGQLKNVDPNSFNQNGNINSGSNFQNIQRDNSQSSSRTPSRNNVAGSRPNQVSSSSNVNRQNSGGNRQSSQSFNSNNGVPVANINRQNVGQNLQTRQNLNQPGRISESDMLSVISANLPKPIHPPGKTGENWNSNKGSQLQHSGGSRQGAGRSLEHSIDNINAGTVPNVQSPSSKPKNHDRKLPSESETINRTIMNSIPNILGGGISVQHGNLMSQSTLSMVNGDVIPAILRPTPDIIVHINPEGIGAGVTLETTKSSTTRTTPRPITAVSRKTLSQERVLPNARNQSTRKSQTNNNSNPQRTTANHPGSTSVFIDRNQSSRPPALQSPPRTSFRPTPVGIPLPTITQRTPSQQQIPRVSQGMSRTNGRTNAQFSVKSNQDVTITVDNSKSPNVSNVRGTTQNTAGGVNRKISRTQPTQNRKVVRTWTHTDNTGTFSQGQVRSDGSFIFTNCKPVGSCIP